MLVQHNPVISWSNDPEVGHHLPFFSFLPVSKHLHPSVLLVSSTAIESSLNKQSVDIPAYYAPFQDVFCPRKATQLHPHQPWDCAIDLILCEPVPRGKTYPLSILEQKAMEKYVAEALKKVIFIHLPPLPLPVFFFVAKKNGGLWPCIDYRSFNKITVKF